MKWAETIAAALMVQVFGYIFHMIENKKQTELLKQIEINSRHGRLG